MLEKSLNKNNINWRDIKISSKIKPVLSKNSGIVLERRYLAKDDRGRVAESAEELFKRVAAYIASADSRYGRSITDVARTASGFYELMANMSFLPNSPTLMNAGRELGQLSACFVLPIEDSMSAIFDSLKQMALIHKSGGGTGFSFSRLRPKNDFVHSTAGISSGPISFMNIFNAATETVKQGGTRRGANMAILNIDHPDIIDFIKAKEDNHTLTNFNISVALTDDFMKAVEQNKIFALKNPRTGEKAGEINARETFNLIVEKAWANGEPGIVFIDRINETSPLKNIGRIESTNPCVTGDSIVLTSEGPRSVKELCGVQFSAIIDGKSYMSGTEGFFSTGLKPIYRLKTAEGYEIRLTADHPVLSAASVKRSSINTEWIKAEKLIPGDRVCLNDHRKFEGWTGKYGYNEGYLAGLLVGDGTIKSDKAIISVWPRALAANGENTSKNDPIMGEAVKCAMSLDHRSDFKGFIEVKGRGEYRMCTAALKKICLSLGITPRNKRITPEMEKCSSEFYKGFLRGLFDTDGSVQGTLEKGVSVRLAQSDATALKSIQRMLHRLGIVSSLYENRRPAGESILPDGKGGKKAYKIRSQHELVISRDNIAVFAEKIGFCDADKSRKLTGLLSGYKRTQNKERFYAEVKNISPDGIEEVFDVHIPGINCFDGNGLILHNCGEQPLLPYESCNLGSINLNNIVAKSNGSRAINLDELKRITRLAVHFLDNVIDLNNYPLDKIREITTANRKIGLGVMGFADLLIRLGIPYDSDESIETAEKIMQTIQEESKAASADLSKERGAFPNFAKSSYAEEGGEPQRNATTTTIAPTGTISIIANSSSGVEPIFALAYERNVMDNDILVEVNPLFEEIAKENGFYSDEIMRQVAEHGSAKEIDGIPEEWRKIFVTAHDISPEWHIRIQAAFQKYTDNAVSKTVNFAHDATVKDIENVYMLAYKLGCKGVTVYRDGSRESQVLSKKSDKDKTIVDFEKFDITEHGPRAPRPRKEVTHGSTRKMTTGCGSLYVTINEDESGLFEVFATMGKGGGCAASQTEAVSRMISLALRSGIDRAQIVKQLKGVRCPNQAWEKGGRIYSCADAIAKAIERHSGIDPAAAKSSAESEAAVDASEMAKNAAETNGKGSDVVMVGVCPDCHGPLEFESGCSVCRSCGFSRCG